MKERDASIDFFKCVFILLMVAFHLAWFADRHLQLKSFVYTFHMPGFLILSGWLAHMRCPWSRFVRRIVWIFVPYAVMEVAYVTAASFLPVREEVGALTLAGVLMRVLWNPLGPYWYLHTWMLCQLMVYASVTWMSRTPLFGRLCVVGCAMWGLSVMCPAFNVANACYFLLGHAVCESRLELRRIFPPTAWAVMPLVILVGQPVSFDRSTVPGVMLVWCMMMLIGRIHAVKHVWPLAERVGRNTLPILLFSPVFTMAAKAMIPCFMWDESGYVFMLAGTVMAVGGSLAVAWAMDRLHLSRLFFGRERILL
ncbi:MAG: acyltransferase [Clostridium sp.]|nr:acyltransferase [Clostridium sp.]